MHGYHRGTANSWKWIIGPITIYALDIANRTLRQKRSYLLVSKHSTAFQGPDIMKIRLPRVFHFQAGQYAELKVPQISKWQWHPFTIASAPHEPELVFYIKAVGDWTTALYSLFGDQIALEGGMDVEVHIRGPFGAPAQHVGQFDRVILIGGGVGATPFCAVVKDAYNWITNWTPRNQGNSRPAARSFIQREPRPMDTPHDSHEKSVEGITDAIRSVDTAGRSHRSSMMHANTTSGWSSTVPRPPPPVLGHSSHKNYSKTSDDRTTDGGTMHTARDYIVPAESRNGEGSSNSGDVVLPGESTERQSISTKWQNHKRTNAGESVAHYGRRRGALRKDHRGWRQASDEEEDGMGTYLDNSIGDTHRHSMDYMTALHSAYLMDEGDEVFQKSLDMMVTMSFGSVDFVRTMQMRRAQRNIRQGVLEPVAVQMDKNNIRFFQNPRVIFLLFMRSVTINMTVFWILVVRFTVAGAGLIFGKLLVFKEGLALYDNIALNITDLILMLVLTFLVGVPPIVEVLEMGSMPIHVFDLFVVTPIAGCGIAVDVLAVAGVGKGVDELFGVFHIFVVWPILTILVLIRLLRVIGERITQAENISTTHSSTKAVDFFWTAPTEQDDRWLVSELNRYADIPEVQLHRYLTRVREGELDEEEMEGGHAGEFLHSNFGRPEWEEIFNEVTESCANNTTVGVFFCGPHSMGKAVQEACMGAMRNSIVRGLQSGAQAMRGLEEIFGEAMSANEYTGETTRASRADERGRNITVVFKRETFL